jgi:hypothetical protein
VGHVNTMAPLVGECGRGIDVAGLTWRVAIGACVVRRWLEGTFRVRLVGVGLIQVCLEIFVLPPSYLKI